ncbi:UNVERIFIED_CONTAM: mannose-ethanolamine phosphotransferase gpi13 [Siphonaria sp. JEL0065]|nr:mannose-ethanolamine phosphotransferase gpi13 [Siphonaria sp. JEL0065]
MQTRQRRKEQQPPPQGPASHSLAEATIGVAAGSGSARRQRLGDKLKQSSSQVLVRVGVASAVLLVLFCCSVVLFAVSQSLVGLTNGGFLLSRLELANTNVAAPPISARRFSRAVVVLIDAFRFDFAVPTSTPKLFNNHLPILDSLPTNNKLLFRIRADPPTTTMQRLKALVTGTLPTFVDAGSNFGSSEIAEDNIISKMRSLNRSLVFMGDDTWVNLFPTQFNESYPFPSFNVQDLHTVDNGCVQHLMPALDRPHEWDFLVAHFLGVDHVGHSFGPDTVPMADKLDQMNGWLTQVFEKVDDDTLVVVLGDHGMDPKGDHGGDSENEVNAALFLYSKQKLWESTGPGKQELDGLLDSLDSMEVNFGEPYVYLDGTRTMPQIDLVPTLASLLGVPIPFGNLGSIIPELFFVDQQVEQSSSPASSENKVLISKEENLLSVTRTNAIQMHTYLVEYSNQRMAADFSVSTLSEQFDKAESRFTSFWETRHGKSTFTPLEVEEMKIIYIEYMRFMRKSLMSARRVWARFDVPLILVGAASFLMAVLFSVFVAFVWWRNEGDISSLSMVLFVVGGLVGAILADSTSIVKDLVRLLPSDEVESVLTPAHEIIFLSMTVAILAFVAASIVEILSSLPKRPYTPSSIFTLSNWFVGLLLLVLWVGVPASDSFTIYEESVTVHLLQAFGLYMILVAFNATKKETYSKLLFHSILFMALTRFSQTSTMCREEKAQTCVPTYNALPNSSVASPTAVLGLLVMIPTLLIFIRNALQKTDSFSSIGGFIVGTMLPVGLTVSFIYWVLDTLHGYQLFVGGWEFMKIVRVWWAKIGFLACSVSCFYVWGSEPSCLGSALVPGEKTGNGEQQQERVIFGLSNPLGSSYLVFLACVHLVLGMFQKPVGGVMLGVELIQILSLFEMCSVLRDSEPEWAVIVGAKDVTRKKSDENEEKEKGVATAATPFHLLFLFSVVLMVLGQRTFFATGHQFTLASIQWEVAFIGLFETNWVLGSLIMALNTFGGPILSILAIPCLVLWKVPVNGRNEGRVRKEVGAAFLVGVGLLGVWGFVATVLAGHFRRHLMVWSVYAPKFLGVDVGMGVLGVVFLGVGGVAVGLCWISYRNIVKMLVEKGY